MKNDNYESILKSLNDYGEFLFNEADERIAGKNNENEYSTPISTTAKRYPNSISTETKKHTEKLAGAIASLILNILRKTDSKKGEINDVDVILGRLSSGTNDTVKSYYMIDEDGLKIYLNYSREWTTKENGCGRCFLDNNWSIDFNYLQTLLHNSGITLTRNTKDKISSHNTQLEIDIVTITYNRKEKIKKDGYTR